MKVINTETLNQLSRQSKSVMTAKKILKETLGNDINKKWKWSARFSNLPEYLKKFEE